MAEEKKAFEDQQLEEVNGGTFDINAYSEETYNNVGISTNYHFFEKDEFYMQLENGGSVQITYAEANEAVKLYGLYKWTLPKLTYERYLQLKLEYATQPEKFYKQ